MRALSTAVIAIALLVSAASADLVLSPLTGDDGLRDYYGTDVFSPNKTSAQLQISGNAYSEAPLGGYGGPSFDVYTLDVQFLGDYRDEGQRSFHSLVITAAFQPGDAAFERMRFFDLDDASQYVDVPFSAFVDPRVLGLPPDDSIHGLSVGGLDASLVAGVDLGVGLDRDSDATVPPMVSVGVQVVNPAPGSKVRFDAFGLSNTSQHGWVVKGNSAVPYVGSGSGGIEPMAPPQPVIPEPATATIVFAGAAAILGWRRRQRNRAP